MHKIIMVILLCLEKIIFFVLHVAQLLTETFSAYIRYNCDRTFIG
ncbi:MAG: hypothetical protein Q7J27_03415 [Syntrophales bacterium]|nr:hypothetical protein [Syntrophales bacterium]